jgi:hypothetical protein
VKITWFLSGPSPATWGRVVDGKIDAVGKAIAAMPAKAAAKAAARSAGAKAEAKAEAKVTELSMATLLSWCFFLNINVLIQDYKSSHDIKLLHKCHKHHKFPGHVFKHELPFVDHPFSQLKIGKFLPCFCDVLCLWDKRKGTRSLTFFAGK